MSLRAIIDGAIADAMAEHPKYFTPKGHEHARTVLVRKVMASFRDGGDKTEPASSPIAPSGPQLVDPNSAEGRAYINLRQLAGATQPARCGDGRYIVPASALNPAVLAFADPPLRTAWLFITDVRQSGAWSEFFRETLGDAPRRPVTQQREGATGILMPWPWPPRKDGTPYSADDGEAVA